MEIIARGTRTTVDRLEGLLDILRNLLLLNRLHILNLLILLLRGWLLVLVWSNKLLGYGELLLYLLVALFLHSLFLREFFSVKRIFVSKAWIVALYVLWIVLTGIKSTLQGLGLDGWGLRPIFTRSIVTRLTSICNSSATISHAHALVNDIILFCRIAIDPIVHA